MKKLHYTCDVVPFPMTEKQFEKHKEVCLQCQDDNSINYFMLGFISIWVIFGLLKGFGVI